MDNFTELLRELGNAINVPLHPDHNGVCKLLVEGNYAIQIEFDSLKDRLLFISFIFEIPPGKFRENVLKEALKANGAFPRVGTLAYSDKNNFLTLFDFYTLAELKIDKLAEYLFSFIEKVKYWKTQLESGIVPSPIASPAKELPSPFFKKL